MHTCDKCGQPICGYPCVLSIPQLGNLPSIRRYLCAPCVDTFLPDPISSAARRLFNVPPRHDPAQTPHDPRG